jgi:putative hydrolase of the HAD superfamily
MGLRIGLISNTHRSLEAFQRHFELDRFVSIAIASSDHGYMKPHPSIFEAALQLADVFPREAVMVGDSLTHDIAGARALGMHGVLLSRSGVSPPVTGAVPVIRTLADLSQHL